MSASIVRRAEFKRQRKYRARARKRNPPARFFKRAVKNFYAEFRDALFPTTTPFLACLERKPSDGVTIRWGGAGSYYSLNV